MNHEDLKIREDTRFVLVQFTGEDLSTYEHIKQSHLQEGEVVKWPIFGPYNPCLIKKSSPPLVF